MAVVHRKTRNFRLLLYYKSEDNLSFEDSLLKKTMKTMKRHPFFKPLIGLVLVAVIPTLAALVFDASIFKGPFSNWGISPKNVRSSINLLDAWKKFKYKKDIVVAVVDTGVDPQHSFLSSNIHVTEGKTGKNNFGMDFSTSTPARTPWDSHGHGSHISGIIKGVFPKVKLLSIKYYNPQSSGKENLDATIRSLKYAINQGVDIINYSGGGPESSDKELKILKRAQKKGILIVASAGNEESNLDNKKNAYFPASYGLENIITVTAHDQSLRVLSSSNYGKKTVDVAAPGYRIRSSLPRNKSGYLTGTSQATAFVSGLASLIKSQFPYLTAVELKEIIRSSSRKEITLLSKCNTGGRIDASRALLLAASYSGKYKRSTSSKKALPRFQKSRPQNKPATTN